MKCLTLKTTAWDENWQLSTATSRQEDYLEIMTLGKKLNQEYVKLVILM